MLYRANRQQGIFSEDLIKNIFVLGGNNIKIVLKAARSRGCRLDSMAQLKDRWPARVYTVMNLRVP
jgi:hypothetical protein